MVSYKIEVYLERKSWMKLSKINVRFQSDIEKVYSAITCVEEYRWRSDLADVKLLDREHFIETSHSRKTLKYTIIAKHPTTRFELIYENQRVKGHIVVLLQAKDEGCEVDFIEECESKNRLLKRFENMSKVRKKQKQYVEDLKLYLNE